MEHQIIRKRVNQKNKPTIKRLLANKCERERVRKINEAFEILKTHIPYCDSGQIRTKLDVLKFAIDYIQILTKMVSQSKGTMLLSTSQTTKAPGFMLNSSKETERCPTSDIYLAEGSTSLFPFEEERSPMRVNSPSLSDDEVFFGGNNEESFQTHPSLHSDQQHQQKRIEQTQKVGLFEESDLIPYWNYEETELPKAIVPVDESISSPNECNDSELTAWLNL